MPVTNQSVEEIDSLHGEPDWLRARRRAARDVYDRSGLPDRSDEEWRRVDFKGFDFEHFKAAGVLRQRGSERGRAGPISRAAAPRPS